MVCASLLAGQLVDRNARRQIAAEPEPECSNRGFELLPRYSFPLFPTLTYDLLGFPMQAPSVSQATRAAHLYQCAGAYREIARPLADLCHNF